MLLNSLSYVYACQKHLASSLKLDNGSKAPYYQKEDEFTLEQIKEEITVLNRHEAIKRMIRKDTIEGEVVH